MEISADLLYLLEPVPVFQQQSRTILDDKISFYFMDYSESVRVDGSCNVPEDNASIEDIVVDHSGQEFLGTEALGPGIRCP